MNKLCAVALVFACGTSAPPPAQPIENKEAGAAATPTTGELHVVGRTNNGGVLELRGDREGAMRDAMKDMAAHCGPNNYTIVQEGEEAVRGDRGRTAWLVHYQCNH